MAFPVRAGAANALADQILKELRDDPRIDDRTAPSVNVTKVIAADPAAPVVELTVSAKVKPSDADAIKQRVLDHASALLAAA